MRTHLQIIKDAGGYKAMAERLSLPAERVRFWERRKSIPLEFWRAVEAAGLATRDEQFEAAEAAAQAARERPPTQDAA